MVRGTSSPLSVRRVATVSSTVKEPLWISVMVPLRLGGTMILWSTTGVSGTVPITSPPTTFVPGVTAAVKSHCFSRSRAGTSTPRVMLAPTFSTIFSRGRWMPS